jgi:sugar phosphate permease
MKLPLRVNEKVRFLILATCFFKIALGLQIPILYVFVLNLGGDLTLLGVIFAIYGVIYAITAFFVSLYLLRYRHFLFSLSFILWALYAFMMYNVQDSTHIYMLQFIAGISTALGRPGLTQILVLNTKKEEYTETYGFYKLLGSFLGALAAYLSGLVGHYYAIRPLFLVMCFLSIVSFIISLQLLRMKDLPETEVEK